MAVKVSKAQVDKLIKEEFQKIVEKKKLQKRVQQINEELARLEEEDQAMIDEVEASGEDKVRSHAWTGDENGDKKFKPKFEKKGSHLLEDEDGEEETLDIEDAGDDESTETLDLASEFAELGSAIEAKIKAAVSGEKSEDEVASDNAEEFEEVEVEDEAETDESGEIENDETSNDEAIEDEMSDEQEIETADDLEALAESKEPNKQVIVEAATTERKNALTEGLDKSKQTAIEKELERMKRLARLGSQE